MNARFPLRALLLDLDGTVADSHGLIFQCYDYALRQHLGQPGQAAVWQQCVGLPLDHVMITTYAYYGQTLAADELAAVKHTYRAHMDDHADDIRAFPGVIETLETLMERGIQLAIVTTKMSGMARRHLETSGTARFFPVVITSDLCERCKPDPEPFLRALDALGVDASEAAGVGDSQHDVRGSKAAGMLAVAATWGTDNLAALLAAEPDVIAESPAELLRLI